MLDYSAILEAIPGRALLVDEAASVLCWNATALSDALCDDELREAPRRLLEEALPDVGADTVQAISKAVQLGRPVGFRGAGKDESVSFDAWPCGSSDGLKVALITYEAPPDGPRVGTLVSESEQRYRKLVELLPEGVVVHSRGIVRFVNPAAVRLWHAESREALEGAEYMPLLHPDDRAFVQERIDRIYRRGESSALREYRILPLDGGVVNIEAAGTLISYEGRPANLVLFRDITARKVAEAQLRDTMDRYRDLFEDSPLALWEEDWSLVRRYLDESRASGVDDLVAHLDSTDAAVARCSSLMQLTDANKACVLFYGARDKAEALDNMERLLPEEAGIVRAALVGLLEGKSRVVCEGLTHTLTGERRDVVYHFKVSPGCESTWDKIIVSVIDLTIQKNAERRLIRLNEMLQKEESERRLLSQRLIEIGDNDRRGMAMELHDHFGQMLTSLKMDLEHIASDVLPRDPSLAERIEGAVGKTIQTITDLKRLASGLMPDMIENLGLAPALRDLVEGARDAGGIEIVFFCNRVSEDLGLEKELAIYRIAQECLNNVLKHAHATRVFVSLVEFPGALSLSIEDNGGGFSPAADSDSLSNGGGLGLHIMRERVSQFGGELTIESEPGRGVMIMAELPL